MSLLTYFEPKSLSEGNSKSSSRRITQPQSPEKRPMLKDENDDKIDVFSEVSDELVCTAEIFHESDSEDDCFAGSVATSSVAAKGGTVLNRSSKSLHQTKHQRVLTSCRIDLIVTGFLARERIGFVMI